MNLSEQPKAEVPGNVSATAGIRAISLWLESEPLSNISDEIAALISHLGGLRELGISAQQRSKLLNALYQRSIDTLEALMPTLIDSELPIPRKTRQLVKASQELLRLLADDLLLSTRDNGTLLPEEVLASEERVFWNILYANSLHLRISELVASPVTPGIWRNLHKSYARAYRRGLAKNTPEGCGRSIRSVYYGALLLGCAQPASFTAAEVDFVAQYLEYFSDTIVSLAEPGSDPTGVFWIDPLRDTPPIAFSRKRPNPESRVFYFSCAPLATQLREQLAELDAGLPAREIGLPAFADSATGRGVLRRLISNWGEPGKRRFPRRRQSYRAVFCTGLDNLWRLFQNDAESDVALSTWMITNESPDGYAVMHVSGKPGNMTVGEITALRTESEEVWQVCIIRWAISENQEHIELGLQVLATRAVPAILALPAEEQQADRLSVLILPEIPALSVREMLVVPSGTVSPQRKDYVLVVENDKLEVREVRNTGINEQNGSIEVFSIEAADLI